MAAAYDFDWFADRLDIAEWRSTTAGKRDAMAECPVHGGSDSLHVTESDGRVLVKCFNPDCAAGYREVVAAVEAAPAIRVTRSKGRATSRVAQPADAKADPLGWYAAYCGVDRDLLDTLPLSARDGWVSHDFPGLGVAKLRQAGTSERRWTPTNAHNPAIWPLDPTMPRDIVLTEGESDCIALRGLGYDAYSAGSASGVPSVADFRAIARRGVMTVFVAYDADEAGQRGAEKAMENAMAAGLSSARIVPPEYDSLAGTGKDWREWAAAGGDALPESNLGAVVKPLARVREETPDTVPWVAYPIAYSGGVTVLAGPPKGGKSTILGHLARCAETGEKFLGAHEVRRGTPVLLLTEEFGVPVVMKADAFGLDAVEVVQRADAVRAGWGLADSLAAAARWVREHPLGIVIIDTLAVWAGIENENDASQTTLAVETIRHAIADRGAAVILVHHTRKGGGIAGEATRGSGAIAAACDVQAELTYHDPSDATDAMRWLNVRGRILDTMNVLVEYDTTRHVYAVVESSELENAALLSVLDGIPRDGEGMRQKDLETLWGMKAGARRINELVAKGLLRRSDTKVREGRGEAWRYWRADPEVTFSRTAEQQPNAARSAVVESEAGETPPNHVAPIQTSPHRAGTNTPTGHPFSRRASGRTNLDTQVSGRGITCTRSSATRTGPTSRAG